MWAATPQVRPFCTWTWKYCKNSCAPVRLHTARNHFSGCGPSANLKSTNTHGRERRESTEKEHSRGQQLLCLGPDSALVLLWSEEQTPVRNTTLSAQSPFNRTDVKKDQMVLMDNIHLRDTLECVFFLSLTGSSLVSDMYSLLCFLTNLKTLCALDHDCCSWPPAPFSSSLCWHTSFRHVDQWHWHSTNYLGLSYATLQGALNCRKSLAWGVSQLRK